MLLMSQNLHRYGEIPKSAVVRINLAWVEDLLEIRDYIKGIENDVFLDLPLVNRFEGYEAGVLMENIYTDGPCTSCENHRWYSYRREGKTGRLITLAMLQSRE